MKRPLLVVPLPLLAACAEEDEGTGSVQMTGVGVLIPWGVLLALLLITAVVVVLLRRRR